METNFGLILITFVSYAVATSEKCSFTTKADDHCSITLSCDKTLEELKKIEERIIKDCISILKHTSITFKVNDVILDATKLEVISKMNDTVLKAITSLNVTGGELTKIPEVLDKMDHLEEIDLSNNKITSVDIDKLVNPVLKRIKIAHNEINDLVKSKVIDKGNNVEHVDLSYNNIKTIPEYYFEKFLKLKTMNLSNNLIEDLSKAHFVSLQHLTDLILSHNKLTKVGDVFSRLENLEVLEFQNNYIVGIDESTFKTIRQLKKLNMSSNKLEDVCTKALDPLYQLSSLDLSKNTLTVIKQNCFLKNIKLDYLNLADNKINTIEPEAFAGKTITSINLSNNKLKGSLMREMLEGLSPTELDLSQGEIIDIGPACFSAMGSTLKYLRLNNNKITNIDISAFENITLLESLDVSHNKLNKITFKTDKLLKLKYFNISHNNIDELETGALKENVALKQINLAHNSIKTLETMFFKRMDKLEELYLHNNPLNFNKDIFKGLQNLKKLSIQETKLESIEEGMFADLKNLIYLNASSSKVNSLKKNAFNKKIEELDLSNNEIEDISDVFTDLKDLRTLLLSKNNIKVVNAATFGPLSKLETVDLSSNEKLVLNDPFNNMESLKKVSLQKIKSVSFEKITDSNIKDLDLSFCGIKDLNAVHLQKLKKIEILNLCFNEISTIDGKIIKEMVLLEKLYLCHNKIQSIEPKTFNFTNKITDLDLSGNQLSEISYGTFNDLKKLKELNLKENSLTSFSPGNLPTEETNIQLILDDNAMKSLDFKGFAIIGVASLSIGGNPIPCSKLQEANSLGLHMTANKPVTDAKSSESFHGISCRNITESTKTEDTFVSESENKNITTIDLVKEMDNRNTKEFEKLNEWTKHVDESISTLNKNTGISSNQMEQHKTESKQSNELLKDKVDNVSNKQTEVFNLLHKVDNKMVNLGQSENSTVKTLAYISTIGVMVLITIGVVKCVLNHKSKEK